jgi:hypothetical protein
MIPPRLFVALAVAVCALAACRPPQTIETLPTLAVLPTLAPPTAALSPTPSPTSTPNPNATLDPNATPNFTDLGRFSGVLQDRQVLGSMFNTDTPRHVYTFDGRAGEVVTLQMSALNSAADPLLVLYDPAGRIVAMDDNSIIGSNGAQLTNIRLPQDGQYSVQASGQGGLGSYRVELQRGEVLVTPNFATPALTPVVMSEVLTPTLGAAVSGARLSDHVPLQGELAQAGDFARFPIFATLGDTITFGVSPTEGSALRPKIELYGPSGELLSTATAASSAADGDALIADLRIAVTGAYVLFVSSEDGSTGGFTVSYGVGATRFDVLRGRTLVDRTSSGDVAKRGQRDVWSLYLNAGDQINAIVSGDAGFDPYLEFATLTGEVIASDDNSGGGSTALIREGVAAQSGLYYLRISAAGAASVGTYTLAWRYINAAATPTAIPGLVPIMRIDDTVGDNQYSFYSFQASRGDRVEIRVIGSAGLDAVAVLLDANDATIAQDDDSGGALNPLLYADIPADGTYTIRINGYLSSGSFVLEVNRLVGR